MKIVEDSPNNLILKEGALLSRILGVVATVAGLATFGVGLVSGKSWVVGAIGLGLAILGLLVTLLTKSDTVVVDKASRQLTVTHSSLLNHNGQAQHCSFDDVVGVELLQRYDTAAVAANPAPAGFRIGNSGSNASQTTLHLTLIVHLKAGIAWTVANDQHSVGLGLGVSRHGLADQGQLLATALSVPFTQTGAPTLQQAVTAVRGLFTGQAESTAALPQVGNPAQPPSVTNG